MIITFVLCIKIEIRDQNVNNDLEEPELQTQQMNGSMYEGIKRRSKKSCYGDVEEFKDKSVQ